MFSVETLCIKMTRCPLQLLGSEATYSENSMTGAWAERWLYHIRWDQLGLIVQELVNLIDWAGLSSNGKKLKITYTAKSLVLWSRKVLYTYTLHCSFTLYTYTLHCSFTLYTYTLHCSFTLYTYTLHCSFHHLLSRAAVTAWTLLFDVCPPLSVVRHSFIQLSELEQRGLNEIVHVFKRRDSPTL